MNLSCTQQIYFSATELLVVVIIVLVIFWGLIIYPESRHFGNTKRKVAETRGRILLSALQQFHKDCGRYPETREGFTPLIFKNGYEKWKGPYLPERQIPSDPWGNPFDYKNYKNDIRIVSGGQDRKANTEDDIIVYMSAME